jgi:hypothetical protein
LRATLNSEKLIRYSKKIVLFNHGNDVKQSDENEQLKQTINELSSWIEDLRMNALLIRLKK